MRSTRWFSALVLALAVACAPVATALAAPASLPNSAKGCSTSAAQGSCGPYNDYPGITHLPSNNTTVSNDVWNPIHGWHQTLAATSPGDWQVTANMPAGNTAVVSYPSVGATFGKVTNRPTPLTRFRMIRSSFAERMHATARTSAWAAYDIWLGKSNSTKWSYEVMIQHDFAKQGPCTTRATATFHGPGNVPQRWGLCKYGSELIWQLGATNRHKVSEHAGVAHILSMLRWLQRHHYLPANAGLWDVGYGWEICSTGGRPETFTVSGYTLRARCKTHGCR
jgi:hypothetical protein